MNTFRNLAVLALLLLLPGCASMSGPDMKPDQLKAIAADKNATVVCSSITGMWGTGRVTVANLDKAVIQNGTVTVDGNCVVTMSNQANPPAVPTSPVPRPDLAARPPGAP